VFLRIYGSGWLRSAFAIVSLARWQLENAMGSINLHLLIGHVDAGDTLLDAAIFHSIYSSKTGLIGGNFQARARQYAEDNAKSSIYLVVDDDQLIIGENWVQNGIECLHRHPEYGILSGWSINNEVPEGPGIDEVWEVPSSVGCPHFIRKGTVPIIPEAGLGMEDAAFCAVVHEKNLKTGFIRNLRYNHLGAHFSSISTDHWNRM